MADSELKLKFTGDAAGAVKAAGDVKKGIAEITAETQKQADAEKVGAAGLLSAAGALGIATSVAGVVQFVESVAAVKKEFRLAGIAADESLRIMVKGFAGIDANSAIAQIDAVYEHQRAASLKLKEETELRFSEGPARFLGNEWADDFATVFGGVTDLMRKAQLTSAQSAEMNKLVGLQGQAMVFDMRSVKIAELRAAGQTELADAKERELQLSRDLAAFDAKNLPPGIARDTSRQAIIDRAAEFEKGFNRLDDEQDAKKLRSMQAEAKHAELMAAHRNEEAGSFQLKEALNEKLNAIWMDQNISPEEQEAQWAAAVQKFHADSALMEENFARRKEMVMGMEMSGLKDIEAIKAEIAGQTAAEVEDLKRAAALLDARRAIEQGVKRGRIKPEEAENLKKIAADKAEADKELADKKHEEAERLADKKHEEAERQRMEASREEVRLLEAKVKKDEVGAELEGHRLKMQKEIEAILRNTVAGPHRDELVLLERKKKELSDMLTLAQKFNDAFDNAKAQKRETPAEHNRRKDGLKIGNSEERAAIRNAANKEFARQEREEKDLARKEKRFARKPDFEAIKKSIEDMRKSRNAPEENPGKQAADLAHQAAPPLSAIPQGAAAGQGMEAAGQGAQALGAKAVAAAAQMNSAGANLGILASAMAMINSRLAAVEAAVQANGYQ